MEWHVEIVTQSTGIENVIASVLRSAKEECAPGLCSVHPILEECSVEAVETLWESPVKTYVPLLALRRVRCCIRAGSCNCGDC